MGWWLLMSLLLWGGSAARAEKGKKDEAIGAFLRGDDLSWDQLEVVATEAGVSHEQILEMKIRDRLEQLITHYQLPLDIAGFSKGMAAGEEFRLYKSHRPNRGALLLNDAFWSKAAGVYDN